MNRSKGFTLIELLIVRGDHCDSGAIAVPNFLEAQTRSKIARVHADLRTAATALESYYVDYNAYPRSHFTNDEFLEPPPVRFIPLTTPVAYMTSVLSASPFKGPKEPDEWGTYYQYSTKKGLAVWPRGLSSGETNAYLNGWYRVARGLRPDLSRGNNNLYMDGPDWMILDRGPDELYFFSWANFGAGGVMTWEQSIVWYDPSNGTVSPGEIGRWQGGGSFR